MITLSVAAPGPCPRLRAGAGGAAWRRHSSITQQLGEAKGNGGEGKSMGLHFCRRPAAHSRGYILTGCWAAGWCRGPRRGWLEAHLQPLPCGGMGLRCCQCAVRRGYRGGPRVAPSRRAERAVTLCRPRRLRSAPCSNPTAVSRHRSPPCLSPSTHKAPHCTVKSIGAHRPDEQAAAGESFSGGPAAAQRLHISSPSFRPPSASRPSDSSDRLAGSSLFSRDILSSRRSHPWPLTRRGHCRQEKACRRFLGALCSAMWSLQPGGVAPAGGRCSPCPGDAPAAPLPPSWELAVQERLCW